MKTIEIKIYDYIDVMNNTDNIREKVLNKHRDIITNGDWDEKLMDIRSIRMDRLGYIDTEFYHSEIFGTSGEGVCITGRLELDKEVLNRLGIEADFIIAHLLSQQIEVSITTKGELFTNSSVLVNTATKFIGNTEIDNWLEKTALEIRDAVGKEIVKISKALLKSLTNYYNYLRSDKALIQYFKDNNIEFYEDGEIYKTITVSESSSLDDLDFS